MKYILPNLTAVLWLFLGATLAAQELPKPPTDAAAMLRASANSLAQEPSFQAEFRHRVEILQRSMVGKGVYRQALQNQVRKHRLEVTLRVGDESSSVEQASNGRFLWVRRNFPGQRNLTRIDLREIERARSEATIPASEFSGETAFHLLGMDGLPGTLAGIAECFELRAPQATMIGTDDAWLIQGKMKPEFLERLAPGETRNGTNLSRLPKHIPSHVVVVLSNAPAWPLFPFRIEYRRDAEAPGQKTAPLVAMEFSNVVRRARFDALTFEFPAGEDSERDITSEFVKRFAKKE